MNTLTRRGMALGVTGGVLLAPLSAPEATSVQPAAAVAQAYPRASGAFMFPELDAIDLRPDVHTPPYRSPSELKKTLADVDKGMRFATDGVRGFGKIALTTNVVIPTGRTRDAAGNIQACYAQEQIHDLYVARAAARNLGRDAVRTMVFVNGSSICNYQALGTTFINKDPLYAEYDLSRTTKSKNIYGLIAHEGGHLERLGHEKRFDCRKKPDDPLQFGAVQDLVAAGCDLVRYPDGKINDYTSWDSVMGGGGSFEQLQWWSPLYSGPERIFLDPTKQIDTVTPTDYDKYYVGVQPGQRYGLRMSLPTDHILREVDQNISQLVFTMRIVGQTPSETGGGPSLRSDEFFWAPEVYGVSANGRETVYLNISQADAFPQPEEIAALRQNAGNESPTVGLASLPLQARDFQERTAESVVYIDRQLSLAVLSGADEHGWYLRLADPSTPQAAHVIAMKKQNIDEFNADTAAYVKSRQIKPESQNLPSKHIARIRQLL